MTRLEAGFIKPGMKFNEALKTVNFEKELRQNRKVAGCTIREKPFWTPARARATPPDTY